MTPEQQRKTIALHFGAIVTETKDGLKFVTMRPEGDTRDSYTIPFPTIPDIVFSTSVPDYLNDRNAIYEALNHLKITQYGEFWDTLHEVVPGHVFWGDDTTSWQCFHTMNATSAQYAEAFLKTLSLWKP